MLSVPNKGQSGGGKSIILPTNPLVYLSSGDKSINVSWDTPKSEVPIKQYNVYYGTTGTLKKVATVTGNSYKITNLKNGTYYYVAVTSTSVEGYENGEQRLFKNYHAIISAGTSFFVFSNKSRNEGDTPRRTLNASDYTLYDVFNTYFKGADAFSNRDLGIYVIVGLYAYTNVPMVIKVGNVQNTGFVNISEIFGGSGDIINSVCATRDIVVCVGNKGAVYYSENLMSAFRAASFVKAAFPSSGNLNSVGYGNGVFLTGGNKILYHSNDGKTWVLGSTSATPGNINHIYYANSKWFVGSYLGLFISTNGTTFDQIYNINKTIYRISYGGGRVVAVGQGYGYYINGNTATELSGLYSSATYKVLDYSVDRFYTVGYLGTSVYNYYLLDGSTTWVAGPPGLPTNFIPAGSIGF